jgi:hypothetical protein
MAIALDVTASGAQTATSPITWSHTTTGVNVVLIVYILVNTATQPTCTYNGNAMTAITHESNIGGGGYTLYSFYQAVGAGVGNQTISCSNIGTDMYGLSESISGASQSGIPDASNASVDSNAAAAWTTTITTVANNDWLLLGSYDSTNDIDSAGSGTVKRLANFNGFVEWDSNAAVGTGSQSLNFTGPTSHNFGYVMLALAPASPFAPEEDFWNVPVGPIIDLNVTVWQ